MVITSFADLFITLAGGQRVGEVRRSLSRATDQMFFDMAKEMDARRLDVEKGLSESGPARRTAWSAVLDSTSKLVAAHDLVAQLGSLERRAAEILSDVITSAAQLIEIANLPNALVPEEVRVQFDAIRGGNSDAKRLARSLLSAGRAPRTTNMLESLQVVTQLRFKALHATLLGEITDVTPDPGAATDGDLTSLNGDVRARVTAVRDAARNAAEELHAESATPAFALGLWAALFEFEQWLAASAAARLAAAAAAATARVVGNNTDAERWAREVGKAYDGLRLGLAFDAGARAILLAYAAHDTRTLSAFAQTKALPVGTATVDLPRLSLANVANAAEGEAVEIDGLVSDAEFRVGGPSNRSVLSLGQSGSVRVLVPHVAADSFGITTGVWVQVRGEVFPNGTDGLDGPVVMVSRIQRKAAAKESFTDALIFAGRDSFDFRPGGLDIVASRVAGKPVTLSELGRSQ